MTKLTVEQLLKNKQLLPASELSAQKEAEALAKKVFEVAAV